MKNTRHFDWMMWVLAVCGIMLLSYLLYHILHETIPIDNRELVAQVIGIIEGTVISIYSYYFGSSAGSRIKDMKNEDPKP